jgi:membrane fusion protein (multidrug efflux system)
MSFRLLRTLLTALAALGPLLLTGCNTKDAESKGTKNAGSRLPVEVKAVERADIRRTLTFVGELRASESVEVSSQIPGRVKKIAVKMGDKVKEGDLLAVIDDSELRAQLQESQASLAVYKASIVKAEAEDTNAKAVLERKEKLAGQKLITPQELDNAKTESATAAASVDVAKSQLGQGQARVKLLQSQLGDSKVKASFAGEIDARYLDQGAVVSPGTPILRLVKKEPIVARFQVDERYIGELRKKMDGGEVAVEVIVDAYPGEIFEGEIARLSPALEAGSRTAAVEAEIPNADGRLMPSMYCRVRVDFGYKTGVIVVPAGAVTEDLTGGGEGEEQATGNVYVVEGGKARLVDVTLGWKQGDLIEVLDGLREGDRVVVEGQASLVNGAGVKIIGGSGKAGQAAGKDKAAGP